LKALDAFNRMRSAADRRHPWCRLCQRAYHRSWSAANRDSYREYQRAYRERNRRRLRVYNRDYQRRRRALMRSGRWRGRRV